MFTGKNLCARPDIGSLGTWKGCRGIPHRQTQITTDSDVIPVVKQRAEGGSTTTVDSIGTWLVEAVGRHSVCLEDETGRGGVGGVSAVARCRAEEAPAWSPALPAEQLRSERSFPQLPLAKSGSPSLIAFQPIYPPPHSQLRRFSRGQLQALCSLPVLRWPEFLWSKLAAPCTKATFFWGVRESIRVHRTGQK